MRALEPERGIIMAKPQRSPRAGGEYLINIGDLQGARSGVARASRSKVNLGAGAPNKGVPKMRGGGMVKKTGVRKMRGGGMVKKRK